MSTLPPVFIELKANASEFTTAMGEARHEVSVLEKEGSGSFDKLAAVGKASLFALGTASIAIGGLSLEMADQFEKSHAKLETALKNAGASFEEFAIPIGVAQKKMESYGYTNAQTQEALANLTTALGDPKKALDSLSLAADLATYKHVDLATAATAVARAQEGNLKALKQLGIDLPIAATSASALAKAHDAVSKATSAASAFLALHSDAVDTSSKYHAAYEKLLGKVSDAQDKVNASASAGKDIIQALGEKIGGQASASAETFAGKMAALKAQSEDVAKNIGLMLIPIIEKLVTGIKDVVDWFGKHKVIAEALAVTIGTVLTVAIGAYIAKMAAAAVATTVNTAKMVAGWFSVTTAETAAAAEAVVAGDAAVASASRASSAVNGLKNLAPALGVVGAITGALEFAANNGPKSPTGTTNSRVPLGVTPYQVVPHAEGGIVTKPHIGLVGEAGPEAIIPLNKASSMGFGGNNVNVTVHVAGTVVQENDLAVSVRDSIAQLMRRRGLDPSIIGV